MSKQVVTPELQQWIIEQAQAGCRPEDVLAAMRASGWDDEVAVRGLEDTLSQFLAERTNGVDPAALPEPLPVPEPNLDGSPARVRAGDREVQVLLTLHHPRIVLFGGLLSDDECDELIAAARPRLSRSETVMNDTGGSEVHASRTSDGMFFGRGESPLCERIEQRIATLLRWPLTHGEGLQVLHYTAGAEYKPHYDYFDPAQPGTSAVLRRGGQRVGTLVMYLNTPARGGGTVFPDAGLEIAPTRGHAVFFSYDRPHPASRTLHGGAPVTEGEKWVATKWLREGEFS